MYEDYAFSQSGKFVECELKYGDETKLFLPMIREHANALRAFLLSCSIDSDYEKKCELVLVKALPYIDGIKEKALVDEGYKLLYSMEDCKAWKKNWESRNDVHQ